MKLRTISFFVSCSAIVLAVSCTSGDKSGSQSETPPPAESGSVDPAAKSDSKGIGKFSSVEIGPAEPTLAEKGEAIFQSRCAVCHKPTEEKLIGPGLKGVTQRRQPQWIMNMIVNAEEMEQKDPVGKALREQYSLAMPSQNLTDDETRQVLEFLRKNDLQ